MFWFIDIFQVVPNVWLTEWQGSLVVSCFMEQKSLRQWQWQPRLDWCLVNSDLLTTITVINCPHHQAGLGQQLSPRHFFILPGTDDRDGTVAHAAEEVGHYNISDHYLYLLSDLSILNTSCHVLIIIIIRRSTLSSVHYHVITHSDTNRQQPVW